MGTETGQKPSDDRPGHSLHDVFISYADADRAWVDGFLIDGLERAGVRCHREAAFAVGVPRLAEFEKAVRSSARILLVLSPAYFATDTASFVDLLAQSYGLETSTWPVIPLRLQPVKLPTRLAMLTALDATNPDEREQVLEKLSTLFQRPIPAAPARPPCPYPGMRAFTLDDGFPFFGRDRECEELLQHLRQSPFLTVIGGSGSGKSSLVFAGLVPRLRKTNLFGPGKWLVRSMRPGEQPLAELARALGADPGNPAAAVAEALGADPEAKRLLLVVDQFEEVFAPDPGKPQPASDSILSLQGGNRAREEGKSEQLCRALQGLLSAESVAVILTVRADFYAELMGTPLWPQIKANRVDVGSLDEAGLREAIYRPAETVGVYVESALIERLASDAIEARSQGILPLVQEVLVQLWEKLERRVLPLRAYAEFVLPRMAYDHHHDGKVRTGLEVAIACHADGVLKRLEVASPVQVEIARRIFVRLVHFGEGRPDTRRQQSVAQLRAGNDPVAFEVTLKALASSRLIILTADLETGRRRADIAHEALIHGWPQLQRWIEESRKAEEVRRKLERKAQEWVDAGTGVEGLLGTGGLIEAESFLAGPDGRDLPEDDPIRRLVRESAAEIRRAEIARETARQRELDHARQRVKILVRSAVLLGVLLIGLAGATLFAFRSRREAKLSQAEAEKQAQIAAVNQTKAEASEVEAQESLRVACKGLDDLLTQVADVDLAEIPQMESVRRLLLEKARSGYDSLRSRATAENDPELGWLTARAYGRLGDIDAMLGDYEAAERSYNQAIERLKEPRPGSPNSIPRLRDLVRCHLGLGVLFKELYRFQEAGDELHAADALRGPLEAAGDTDDRQMMAEIDYQRGVVLAKLQEQRGFSRSPTSDSGRESERVYQRAIQAQAGLVQSSHGQPGQRAKLGRYLNNLGNLLAAGHRWDEAEKTFREVIDLVKDTDRLPGSRWQHARASYNLGTLPWLRTLEIREAAKNAQAAGSSAKIQSARMVFERLREEFPEVPSYREELAKVCTFLGRLERDKAGQADLERALGLASELADRYPNVPKYRMLPADVCRALAENLLARNDATAAESFARKSIAQLDTLKSRYAKMPEYLNVALGRSFYQWAKTLVADVALARSAARETGGYDKAHSAVNQAVLYHQAALESSPESPRYRQWLWDDYDYETLILLQLATIEADAQARRRHIEGAADNAEQLPRVLPDRSQSYLRAARFLVQCAHASGDQGGKYFDRAVNVLKKGVEHGVIREAKDLDNRALDPLNSRDDFQKLRQSLKPAVGG
jgi:tetratricopeptide (TPR) repeat protein